MASLENNNLLLSGKIGNLVFRIRNGKVYITNAPKKYKISRTKAAKEGREKFLFFVKMASAIQSNFVLELAWKNDQSSKGTIVNKLMKLHYKDIVNYNLSGFNLVNSEDQFLITPSGINYSGMSISAIIAPLGSEQKISTLMTPVISAQGFVLVFNPALKMKNKFKFLTVSSSDLPVKVTEELNFSFMLNKVQVYALTTYPERYFLFNLVLKSSTGKPIRFSNTVFTPLNIMG